MFFLHDERALVVLYLQTSSMSYDSGGSTFGGGFCRGGDGIKTGDTSGGLRSGDGLAGAGGGTASDTNDTFSSPPFRGGLGRSGGVGGVHDPYYNFADHVDVVDQQYEKGRQLSHGFATTQHQPYQFANTSRSPRGGAGRGAGRGAADSVRVCVPKRPRPSYTSDDDVQPTRAFGASPGTKRALSEMMANDLLRLNVSPTGGSGGSGAHQALSADARGGLSSSTGAGPGPGGWHHAAREPGKGRGQGQDNGGDASLTSRGFSIPPSCDGGGGDSGGGDGGWPISPLSPPSSDVLGVPLAVGGGGAHGSIQAPPSLFGLLPVGTTAGGECALTVPHGMETRGRDATTVWMSITAGGGICSHAHHGSAPDGVEFDASDEQLTMMTPAKSSVNGKFGPSSGSGEFETTNMQSPTSPRGGAQVVFTPQPQQQLVLPELMLRRRSALSQQLGGSLTTGLPVLGTLNMPSSNFLLGCGGTAGDNSTMPSSPSADVSPRADLRKQAILKRASFHVHPNYSRQSLSLSPRNGLHYSQPGGFNPSATSPTSPSSLTQLLLATSTVANSRDGKFIEHAINADDGRDTSQTGGSHDFDMDTPIIG